MKNETNSIIIKKAYFVQNYSDFSPFPNMDHAHSSK